MKLSNSWSWRQAAIFEKVEFDNETVMDSQSPGLLEMAINSA